ncbi:transcription factor grauzone-like isoform X2 [Topomyia yanbarensis]|uniref:transcription factor grauzone-like isoform X2 n=1 Tax=Topomyia yanbarensis TaxID=2498891 RepID=UPI00273C1467|nr:transcription factor grauzone-like isoform X2 [Topomyia yanbarensis]
MFKGELENCFTCFRQTDSTLPIQSNDESIEEIFVKHFWFTKDEYRDRSICTSCWEKIDEFHKFYCEVEKVHSFQSLVVEVKMEEHFTASDDDALAEPKEDVLGVETQNNSESKTETPIPSADPKTEEDNETDCAAPDQVLSEGNQSNSSDSQVQPDECSVASRRSKRIIGKRPAKVQQTKKREKEDDELNTLIRQRISLTCHKCSEPDAGTSAETFETFYQLRLHFRKVHNSNGYVFCCDRKWSTKMGLMTHLKKHEPAKGKTTQCPECKCTFKDKNSYEKHKVLVHTPEEQKRFKCDRCSKAFAAEYLLNSHIKWHEVVEKKNHYCTVCNKYFLRVQNLRNHIITHNRQAKQAVQEQTVTKNPATAKAKRRADEIAKQDKLIRETVSLNCSQCGFLGETFGKLVYHALKEHGNKYYAVICCDRRFGSREQLYEHCLRHLNPDHFRCEICGKSYADSSALQSHRWRIHTPVSERPFKCEICGDAFVKDYLLKKHMDTHLCKEQKSHFCELCNRAYSNALYLRVHQQKKHGAVCDWVCDVCAKGFAHRGALEEHRLTHTQEGLASLKMQCEKCKKWLINKGSYSKHKRICYDTGGPVKCDICGKESVNEAALMGHKNFHHSKRPMLKCSYCDKECRTPLRLKEHEATHTGAVLYQCPYCPRTSNSSSNMYSHKKTAHAEQWAEEVATRYYKR